MNAEATSRTVLKVRVEGDITSFRYPHFIQQVQPTYEMPPPSTIYGHVCSTVGQLLSPESLWFAYRFTFEAKFRDLEYVYLEIPYVQPNPFQRELLFKPNLTLYLDPPDLEKYFLNPVYPVALGRSQDLMSYISVEKIALERAERAYFEHTLLPTAWAPQFGRTVAVTMARYVDKQRRPFWQSYAMLKDRVIWPPIPGEEANGLVLESSSDEPIWVDPSSPADDNRLHMGLIFHSFSE